MIQKKNNQSGYALYTAVAITGLLMLVAYATANISLKELSLSGYAADSHVASYNTDTGLECALYWDLKNTNATPPGSVSAFDENATPPLNITCNNISVPVTFGSSGGNPTRSFQLNLAQGCTTVLITKVISGATAPSTIIQLRGYNNCSGGSGRLERGVIFQY